VCSALAMQRRKSAASVNAARERMTTQGSSGRGDHGVRGVLAPRRRDRRHSILVQGFPTTPSMRACRSSCTGHARGAQSVCADAGAPALLEQIAAKLLRVLTACTRTRLEITVTLAATGRSTRPSRPLAGAGDEVLSSIRPTILRSGCAPPGAALRARAPDAAGLPADWERVSARCRRHAAR